MVASKWPHSAAAACTAALVLFARASSAGSTVQLAGILQSDDLLASSGAEVEREPALDLDRPGARSEGRDSALRMVTRLDEPGFLPAVRGEAELRLELRLEPAPRLVTADLRDLGSWLGLSVRGTTWRLALRSYPLDTDYERLGHHPLLVWGGTDVRRAESIFVDQPAGAPGARVELALSDATLFTVLKWTSSEPERRFGAMFGGHFMPRPWLGIDVGFGYFQRGPASAAERPSFVQGASLRLTLGRGTLEPELSAEPFRPPSLRHELEHFEAHRAVGASLALEGVALLRRVFGLGEEQPERLVIAPGAALYGSLRGASFALHAAVTWRSPELLMINTHGWLAARDGPSRARPEASAFGGASLELADAQLVPSLELGCLLPAALVLPSALSGVAQAVLIRDGGGLSALPFGAEPLPLLALRASLRFRASPAVSLAVLADYERDPNRVAWLDTPSGPAKGFAPPDGLRLTAASWARF